MKPHLALALLVSLVLASAASTTYAQIQTRAPYTPSRPTISPYFNYFRGNTGGVPNYYSFVRPQIQLRNFVQQQQAFDQQAARFGQQQNIVLQQQAMQIQDLGRQLQFGTPAVTGSRAIPGTYMNLSHFYGSNPGGSTISGGGTTKLGATP